MSDPARSADVVVLGAGAAGLMCAATAAARGRKVLVLERNRAPGRKILVSGGGRCNFTNLGAGPENFVSDNPHFCKSALARFGAADFLAMVEDHDIDWHEKHAGQLFCDHSSKAILGLLLEECRLAGAPIRTEIEVRAVLREEGGFRIATSSEDLTCEVLVVATGGLSWPKLGASDLGLRLARQFGLALTPTRPGLASLVIDGSDGDLCRAVSGVSFKAAVAAGGESFVDDLLFTHRGLSGPAVLQASNYWRRGEPLIIDLLPGRDAAALFSERPTRTPAQVLARVLPQRFAKAWCARHRFERTWADASAPEQQRLLSELSAWTLHPIDTEGYAKAEVTVGGVATSELSSRTLEAKNVPGLHFIGEVVDVTGWLGGYNFQWAWASGRAAGESV